MDFFKKLLASFNKPTTVPVPRGTFFDTAINRILSHEGGYVNHKDDPGGETNFGISKRSYPNEDIKHMTHERAKSLYKRDFWEPIKGDSLPNSLAFQLLDFAINSGTKTAVRHLQRAMGVAIEDGIMGPITLGTVNSFAVHDLVQLLLAERLDYYTRLSTFNTFGRGWSRRIAQNLKYNVTDT